MEKAVNLDRRRDQLYKLVSNLTPGAIGDQRNWLVEIWDEYIIIQDVNNSFQKVPYFVDGDTVKLTDQSNWEKVEKKEEWLPAKSNALKAVSEDDNEIRVANYMILWGDEKHRDLEGLGSSNKNANGTIGEFFTPQTDLESEYTKSGKLDLDWEHRRDNTKGSPGQDVIGYVDWSTAKADERGLWVERAINRAGKYAKYLKDLIKAGIIGTSSEAKPDLVQKSDNGEITKWGLYRDTLTVTPMEPRMITENTVQAIKALQDKIPALKSILPQPEAEVEGESESTEAGADQKNNQQKQEKNIMSEKLTNEQLQQLDEILAAREAKAKAEAEAKAAEQQRIDEAVKAEKAKWEAEQAKSNRLPGGMAFVREHQALDKYEHVDAAELGLVINTLRSHKEHVSPDAYKALAGKMFDLQDTYAKSALRFLGSDKDSVMKAATDPMYSTLSNAGADWVGTAYSTALWEKIRAESPIVNKISTVTIPDGYSSEYFPLESTDPTWYKVPETTANNATTGIPNATITASQAGTANKQITVGKMGARVTYTGEMVEDSLIAFAPQMRMQLEKSGREMMEYICVDGDTETGASTNINDIAGTPASTDLFLLANGFRKLALVTNTANSRSASGSLVIEDFLETMKLLGSNGLAAADLSKISFVVDPNVYFAAMNLPEVKTRDVNAAATVENGFLKRAYGVEILPSWFMHYKSSVLKSNSAGKVDQDTTANNAYGAILAVRWDQWKLAYKRRMTIETTRRPESDSYEIVALARWGLGYRDTEASAISYYVGV